MAQLDQRIAVNAPRAHNPKVRGSSPLTATKSRKSNDIGASANGDASVVRIPLTRGLFALIDAADYPEISKHKWHAIRIGAYANKEYAARGIVLPDGTARSEHMHCAILGKRPGFETDHINGNGLDNRRCNLRFATRAQNARNKKGWGSTGFKGVYYWPSKSTFKKYLVNICCDRKIHHVGLFNDPVEAAKAYDAKARELHGEFANLNFPEVSA